MDLELVVTPGLGDNSYLVFSAGEAVVVDQVLPDRHGVPPVPESLGDEITIGLAGARRRGARRRHTDGVGGHRPPPRPRLT